MHLFFPDGTVMTSQYLLASCPKVGKPTFLLICINAFVLQQYNIHEVLLEQKTLGSLYQSSSTLQSTKKLLAFSSSYQSSLSPKVNSKVLLFGSSYQSSLTPLLTNKLLAIESSYQSSLIPQLTNKCIGIRSSYQSSLFPQLT